MLLTHLTRVIFASLRIAYLHIDNASDKNNATIQPVRNNKMTTHAQEYLSSVTRSCLSCRMKWLGT